MMIRLSGTPRSHRRMRNMDVPRSTRAARGQRGAGSIVRERHRFAGRDPATDNASDETDQEGRQGAERSVASDDGSLRVDCDDGRSPRRRSGKSAVPDTEIAGTPAWAPPIV